MIIINNIEMKNLNYKYIFVFFILFFSLSDPSYGRQLSIEDLILKIRDGASTVQFTADTKVEISRGRRIRVFTKRIISNPMENKYSEEIVLTEEMKKRIRETRKRQAKNNNPRSRQRERQWGRDKFRRDVNNLNDFAKKRVALELLSRNYNIEIESGHEILNRKVVLLSILPKFELRQGHKIWIDEESGIIVKREIFNSSDLETPIVKEEITFLNIEKIYPKDELETNVHPNRRGQRMGKGRSGNGRNRNHRTTEYKSIDDIHQNFKTRIRIPTFLPEGFVLDKIRVTRERRNVAFHQIYTDGILMFSIFQTKGNIPKQFANNNRNINSRRQETILSKHDNNNNNYIIIGYVNSELLTKVLESFPGN